MMKKLTIITISVFLCFYMASCVGLKYNLSSEKEPKGFRGIEWGTDINNMSSMAFDGKSSGSRIIYYTKKNEKLKIGVVNAKKITYGFYNGRFCSVYIYYRDPFRYAMYNILETAYGKPIRENLLGVPNYLWENQRIAIRQFIFTDPEINDFVTYNFKPICYHHMHQDEKKIMGERYRRFVIQIK